MPNYNPYNMNYYMQDLQNMKDRIDRTMQQYAQTQTQMQQPMQPITQNFQIAPSQTQNELEARFVNNVDEVKNIFVMRTGIFTTKDFSTIFVKDINGNIRTFNTEEVLDVDERDLEIRNLRKEIEELKSNQVINREITLDNKTEKATTTKKK